MSKNTKVVLTFDDARMSEHIVRNILVPLSIPATFYITTGMIEKSIFMDNAIAMSKEEVLSISKNSLFEIAAHGDRHKNEFDDIETGINKMKQWGLISNKIKFVGFSSPGTEMNDTFINQHLTEIKKLGINYIRLSYRYKSKALLRIICRKLSRIIHSKVLYSFSYRDTLVSKDDRFILYSVPILRDIKLGQVEHLIKTAINNDQSIILMFHSISKKDEKTIYDPWIWDYRKFEKLCIFLKKQESLGSISICTAMDYIESTTRL